MTKRRRDEAHLNVEVDARRGTSSRLLTLSNDDDYNITIYIFLNFIAMHTLRHNA